MSKKQKGVFEGKLMYSWENYYLGTKSAKKRIIFGAYDGLPAEKVYGKGYIEKFCQDGFHEAIGIKLEEGEEVLVKITIETTPIKVKK